MAVSAAAMMAGTKMQQDGEKKTRQKMQELGAEIGGDISSQQRQGLNAIVGQDGSAQQFDPTKMQTNMAAKNAAREGAYSEALTPASGVFETGSAPAVVQEEVDRQTGKTHQQGLWDAQRRGKLEGFGDVMLNNAFGLQQSGGLVNMHNNFGQGFAALMPAAQMTAQNAGAGKRSMGQLFNTAGSIGMMIGGGMMGAGGAAGAGAAGKGAGMTGAAGNGFGAGATPNYGYAPMIG
jgi:hypothetical protein